MLAILTSTIVLLSIYIWRFYENVKRYPKGPTPLPLIGNLHNFNWRQAHIHLSVLSKEYGNVFTIWLPRPYVCIMDYDDIKTAFKGDDMVGRSGLFPDTVFQNMENGGVIFSDGDVWKEQRRVSLHILRDFGMGKNVMEQLVSASMEECIQYLDASDNKKAMDFRWPIQLFVGNVISETLYGIRYKYDDCERMRRFADTLQHEFDEIKSSKLIFFAQNFKWLANVPIIGHMAVGRFLDIVKPMKDIIVEDMETALKNYDVEDEPECFVQAYYQKMQSNPELNKDQLINVCMDFYLAGMETTSTTLRWGMLHMADNQRVQDKMRKEIGDVIGFERMVTLNDKPRLPYCGAAINELQRHANIIPMNLPHRTVKDTVVAGHVIPKDTLVYGQISHVLTNSPVYIDTEQFQPERFLMEDGATPNKKTLEHLIPFSIGKRQCAGESMARMELFIGLVTLVQKYKIEARPGQKIDLEPQFSAVLLPKQQLLQISPVKANSK